MFRIVTNNSAGPAFWVQKLSPANLSSFLGYLMGWTTNAFWWLTTVSNCLYMAQFTLGLAQAFSPGYVPSQWQCYLTYIAYAIGLFLLNLPPIFRAVPRVMVLGIVIIIITSIFIIIALLVRSTPKQSAYHVFVDIANASGWSSDGVVFFIALLPGIISVFGFDATTHITEEVDQPSKQIPQVMMGSAVLSAVSGFIMAIVYSFCNTKPENLLQPFGNQPLLQLFYDGLRSKVLISLAMGGVIVSFFCTSIACFTSWNRLYWSTARMGGLPFSQAMSKLSSRDQLPVNALVANLLLVIALGAVQIGSLTSLNALASGGVICMTISYCLSLGLALWRGRDFLPRERWLDLGRLGTPVQIISILWCIFISIFLSFPLYLPIEIEVMNWASVVFAGIMACSILYWLIFRSTIKSF